jgi:hypothetical protein
LVLSVALAGCGYVGDPQPPSLDIPAAVSDLRAWEYGDRIVVAFTVPSLTTEGLPLRGVSGAELLIAGRSLPLPPAEPGPLEHDVSAGDLVGQTVEIMVRTSGPKGKLSAWSNAARLEVIPPLETPSGVRAENVVRGVALSWRGAGPKYRVFRAADGETPQPIAETGSSEYVDETALYGQRYRYLVQAIASDRQQSVLAAPVSVTPEDVFAPAPPAGVSAAATTQAIELTWERNSEVDLAGYNVYRYRAAAGGEPERIGTLVAVPAFTDSRVEAGTRYRYTVSAVDTRGNESARSAPVDVVAQ